MTDKELLELAAKAAGITVRWSEACHVFQTQIFPLIDNAWVEWNPLTADGDALRLAVKLGLLVDCDDILKEVEVVLVMHDYDGHDDPYVRVAEPYGADPCAATRRAIVRAAAEIGKGMK